MAIQYDIYQAKEFPADPFAMDKIELGDYNCVYTGNISSNDDTQALLHEVFSLHCITHGMHQDTMKSMSIGDIIAVQTPDTNTMTAYCFLGMNFKPVATYIKDKAAV